MTGLDSPQYCEMDTTEDARLGCDSTPSDAPAIFRSVVLMLLDKSDGGIA